jgi:hypothetical protein
MQTLFAYVEGFDHSEIEEKVVQLTNDFISSGAVRALDVWLVNQRRTALDGVEEWDLGVNLTLPDPGDEPVGWFSEVEAVLDHAVALRRETQCNIVVGAGDEPPGAAEDILVVDSDSPDVDYLRTFLGVES